ncbi:MAG: methyltransferase [Byssovorax sp.]
MLSLRSRTLAFSLVLSLPLLGGCGAAGGVDAASAPPSMVSTEAGIKTALAGPQRPAKERARDVFRHPFEVLTFFGLRDDMTVVELNPGEGWFTAVLAPTLRDRGKLFVTNGDPAGDPTSERTKNALSLLARFAAFPGAFDKVKPIVVHPKEDVVLGPPESADMVVTFRNLHNWIGNGNIDPMLASMFKVLKHGGILGVTDHRAGPDAGTDAKTVGDTGYVPEAFAIKIIEAAGFKLAGKSEVNANPKDTKDYPKGVWTLPPSYELGDVDHARYEAIGESDRMTLRFVKP